MKHFGDERRTIIDADGLAHAPVAEVASLHEREPVIVAYTRAGALKSLPAGTSSQRARTVAPSTHRCAVMNNCGKS